MRTCMHCHFETVLDDEAVTLSEGRCICLRCFTRLAGTALVMPKPLRRALIRTLAETAPAQ